MNAGEIGGIALSGGQVIDIEITQGGMAAGTARSFIHHSIRGGSKKSGRGVWRHRLLTGGCAAIISDCGRLPGGLVWVKVSGTN